MAWTSPRTWVSGILSSAALNTDVRDNENYLKGLLDGTGTDAVITPTTLQIANTANWLLALTGGFPLINFDANDYIIYDRTNNLFRLGIGGADKLDIDANGKITGGAVWNSGRFAVAAGATVDTNHGWLTLGLRPAFVLGFYQAGTQTPDVNIQQVCGMGPASTEKVRITLVDGAKVRVVSGDSVSNTVVLYAILGPTS
jgi:hypothetical protein